MIDSVAAAFCTRMQFYKSEVVYIVSDVNSTDS